MSQTNLWKIINRPVAVFVLAAFIATNFVSPNANASPISSAQTANRSLPFPEDLSRLKVPKPLGAVQDYYNGEQKQPVLIIQDAHAVPDAQKSIEMLIAYFAKKYGVRKAGFEGASDKFDAGFFRSFPDRRLLRKVLRDYHNRGELAAGTTAAIFDPSGVSCEGLEDWAVYRQGLRFYLDAQAASPGILEQLERKKRGIEQKKSAHYSKELIEADRALEAFYGNASNLSETVKVLAKMKAPAEGSMLSVLLSEENASAENEAELLREVKSMAGKIRALLRSKSSGRLSEDLRAFNLLSQQFETSRISAEAFALPLKEIAVRNGFRIERSPELERRIGRQKMLRDIQGTRFFEEFERYSEEVKAGLFKGEADRKLDLDAKRLRLLEKLAKFELSRKEWEEIKKVKSKKEKGKKKLGGGFDPHFAFYENAEKRDKVFVEQLIKLSPSLPVLFIAGGFHAEGLMRLLRERKISYVLLMPRINELPKESPYSAQMRGDVSWKGYFEAEKDGSVDLSKAFIRAVRDRLIKGDSEWEIVNRKLKIRNQNAVVVPYSPSTNHFLKRWRDQIIRDLAGRGEAGNAGQYTRWIDEVLLRAQKEERQENLLARVGRFIEGLRGLDARGELSDQNILGLLGRQNMAAAAVAGQLSGDSLPKAEISATDRRQAAISFPSHKRSTGERFELRAEEEVSSAGEFIRRIYRGELSAQDWVRIPGGSKLIGAEGQLNKIMPSVKAPFENMRVKKSNIGLPHDASHRQNLEFSVREMTAEEREIHKTSGSRWLFRAKYDDARHPGPREVQYFYPDAVTGDYIGIAKLGASEGVYWVRHILSGGKAVEGKPLSESDWAVIPGGSELIGVQGELKGMMPSVKAPFENMGSNQSFIGLPQGADHRKNLQLSVREMTSEEREIYKTSGSRWLFRAEYDDAKHPGRREVQYFYPDAVKDEYIRIGVQEASEGVYWVRHILSGGKAVEGKPLSESDWAVIPGGSELIGLHGQLNKVIPSVKAPFASISGGARVSIGLPEGADHRKNLQLSVREMTSEEREIYKTSGSRWLFRAEYDDAKHPGRREVQYFYPDAVKDEYIRVGVQEASEGVYWVRHILSGGKTVEGKPLSESDWAVIPGGSELIGLHGQLNKVMPSVKAPFASISGGEKVSIGLPEGADHRKNLQLSVREMTSEEREIYKTSGSRWLFRAEYDDAKHPGRREVQYFYPDAATGDYIGIAKLGVSEGVYWVRHILSGGKTVEGKPLSESDWAVIPGGSELIGVQGDLKGMMPSVRAPFEQIGRMISIGLPTNISFEHNVELSVRQMTAEEREVYKTSESRWLFRAEYDDAKHPGRRVVQYFYPDAATGDYIGIAKLGASEGVYWVRHILSGGKTVDGLPLSESDWAVIPGGSGLIGAQGELKGMMPSVKAPFENVGRGERVSIGPRDVASKRENLELLVREMTAEEQRERKIESSVQRAFIFWARFNDPGNHVQNLFFYTDGNSYLADKNLKQSGVSDTFAMIQYIGQGKWQKAQQTFNDLLWQFPVFFRDVYIHSWVFSFLASHAGLPTSLEGEKLVRLEADDPIGFVSKGPMDQALTLVFGKDRMPLRMSIDTTREMQEGAARTETARGIRPPAVRIIGNMLDLPFRREGDALSVAGKDLLPAQESDFNLKPLKLVYLTSRPHKFVGLDGATHIFTDLDMQKTVLEIRSVMEKGGLLVIPADGEHFTPEYIESMRRLGFEAVMSEAVKVRLSGEQVAVISESLKRGAGEAIREKLNGIGSEFMVFRLVNPKAVAEGELSFQLESGEQTEAERIASPYVNGSGGFDFSTVDWNQFPGIRFEAGDPVLIRAEVGEQEGFLRDLFSGLDVQRMQPYKIFQQLRERCLVRQSELWRLFPAAENRRSVILDKLARQFLWWMLDVNNRSGAMAFYERYDLGRFKGDLVSNYEALRDEILQPSNAKLWGASPLLGLGISAQQLRGELEAFAAFLSRESAQGDERLVGGETADTGRAEMRSASDEAEPSKNFETGRFEMRNSDEESSGGEELRARRKAEAAVLQKLFTVMDREIRETIREAIEKEGGGESGYLRFSYIQRTLARVKREKNEDGSLKYPEFQRFSENHGDVLFDIADYLFAEDTSGSDALLLLRGYHPIVPLRRSSGNALLFSPELSEEMETLWAVVDHVAGYGEDPSFEKPAEILRELEQWEKHYLIGVIIHRLARQMESASAKTVARTRDFLKQYLSDRLNRSGGLILGFCRKLIDDYLRKEYEAVFIGRGTEQLQRITRKMLVRDGQDEYLPKLREIFLSTDLVKASGEEQRAEYFGREHLFDLNKAVIVDAGFYASVARPLVKLLKRSAIQAEFFLFQYRSVNAPKGSLRRLLADLRDTVFEYGTGYNAVLDPRERYLPQFTSAVFLIDDLLGKKYEAVYRFGEDRLPETRPTLTPKYYELSNQVVDEWFEREMAARQEGGEGTARRAELRNAIDPLGGILPAEKDAAKAGQMRRELSRQTAVFYPAALNDTPSLSVLNALFPDSRIIYNDALLMRKQGALSSFHYAKKHPGLNLENIEDAIRMIRDLFMERKPGPAIQNIEAEVLRRERRVFRLKLFFSPEEARKQGRDTLSVEYRLGKFEDIADEFPAVYVNYPGFQGLLAGDAGFWRGVVDKIKPGGFLVIPEWVLRYLNGLATAQTDGARDLRELLAGHFETGVVLPSENGAPEIYAYRKRSELRSVSDEAEPSKNFETGRFEIRRESRRFAVRESLDSARFEMRSVGDFAPDELVLTKEQYGAVKREIFAIEDDFRSAKEKKVFGEGSSDAAFVNAFHDGYSDSTIALWSKVPREDGMIHLRRGDLEDDRGSLRLAREMFAVYRDNPAGFKLTEAMLQEGGRHFSRVVHQAAPLLENETAHVSKEAIDFVDGILGRLLAEIDRLLTLPEVRSEIRDENKVTVAGRFFGPMRARTAKAVGFLATFLPLMGAFGAIAIDTVHSRPHHFLMGGVGGFALQMIIRSFQSGGWKRMRLPRWETLKTDLIVNVSPLAMQYFNRERNIENPLTVHFIVGIILGAFFQAGEFLRAQFGRGAPANPDRSLFEREISTKNLRRYLLNIFFFGWVAKIFSVLLFTPVYKVVDQTSAKAFFFYEIAFAAVFILSRHFSLPFVFVLMAAGVLGNQLEKYLTGGVIDQIPAFEGDRMNFEDFAIDIGMAASGVMMVQLLVWLFKHRKDLYLRNLLSFRLQKEAAPRLPWYAAVAKYSLMFGLLLLPFGVKDRFTTSYQPNRPVAIKAVRVPTPASQFAFDEKVEFFFGQLNKGNRYNVGDFMLLKPVEKEIYLDLMFREREFLKKFILAKIEEAGGNPGLSYEKKVAAVRRSLGNNLGQLLLNMLDDIESLGELSEAALAKDAARFLDEFLYARHPAVSAFPGKNLPTASETNMTSLRRRLCINELLMGWRHPESDLIPEFEKRLGELAQKEPEKIIALGSQIDGFYLPEGFRQKVKNLTEKIARELKRQQEIRDQEEFDKARLREGVPEGMNDDRNPKSYDKLLAELSQQVPATISSAGFVRSEIREIGVEEFAVKLQARLSKRIDEMTAVVLAGPVVDANYVKALHAIVDAWGAQFRSSEVSEEQGAPTIAIDFGAGDGETTVDGLIDHLLGAGNFKTVIFSGMTKRAIERKARLTDAGIRVSTVKNPDGISSGQIYPFRIYPVLSKNPHGKTRNPARINIEVRGREEAGTGWTPLEESVESGLQVFLAAYLVRELGDPARFLRADAGARAELLKKVHQMFSLTPDLLKYEIKEGRDGEPPQITFYTERPAFLSYLQNFAAQFKARTEVSSAA